MTGCHLIDNSQFLPVLSGQQWQHAAAKTMKTLLQLQHLALWQTHLVAVLAALDLPLGLSYVYKGNGLSTYARVCACVCLSAFLISVYNCFLPVFVHRN